MRIVLLFFMAVSCIEDNKEQFGIACDTFNRENKLNSFRVESITVERITTPISVLSLTLELQLVPWDNTYLLMKIVDDTTGKSNDYTMSMKNGYFRKISINFHIKKDGEEETQTMRCDDIKYHFYQMLGFVVPLNEDYSTYDFNVESDKQTNGKKSTNERSIGHRSYYFHSYYLLNYSATTIRDMYSNILIIEHKCAVAPNLSEDTRYACGYLKHYWESQISKIPLDLHCTIARPSQEMLSRFMVYGISKVPLTVDVYSHDTSALKLTVEFQLIDPLKIKIIVRSVQFGKVPEKVVLNKIHDIVGNLKIFKYSWKVLQLDQDADNSPYIEFEPYSITCESAVYHWCALLNLSTDECYWSNVESSYQSMIKKVNDPVRLLNIEKAYQYLETYLRKIVG
eukprot:NODE_166_length_16344_cov_0.418775.p2 type:complete len:397 gc:universal NODE_166_length_16344_cov_0.418775:209-1399(+)